MTNLLRANFFRMRRDHVFWTCFGTVLACSVVSPRPNPQGPTIGMPTHPPMSHAAVKNRDAVRTVRKLAR